MTSKKRILPGSLIAAAVTLALAGQAAQATSFETWLRVAEYTKSLPTATGTRDVLMWGYQQCPNEATARSASGAGCLNALGTVPVIEIPPAANTVEPEDVIINVWNGLPAHAGAGFTTATSLYIPGQQPQGGWSPTRWSPTDPNYPAADPLGQGRIRSFATEVPRQEHVSYRFNWNNLKPGTYLFHSGTHPQLQVQMGLYGVMIVRPTAGVAYPGVPAAARESTLVFSEVDPAVHDAVRDNTYGPAGTMTSTVNYAPRFFLINGEPYSAASQHIIGAPPGQALQAGEPLLLRLVNAGIENHSLQLLGGRMSVVADDGNVLSAATSQYAALLPAGKTLDAVFTPPARGVYPLYDRSLRLVNDTATPGGMFATIDVRGGGGSPQYAHPPGTLADFMYLTSAAELNTATGTWSQQWGAPNLLANDKDIDGGPLRIIRVVGETPDPIPSTGNANAVGNVVGITNPAGAAGGFIEVNRAGRTSFRAPTPDWVGVASFSYQVVDNTGLESAPTPARVVRDMHVSPVFHTTTGATGWNLSGTLRTLPAGDVTVEFVQNLANTNCTRVDGIPFATVTPVASGTGATIAYSDTSANPSGCNRIRVTAQMPAVDGVPAHEASYDMAIVRQP